MMKLLSALAMAAFVVVAAPSVQAAPASGLLGVKTTNSVVESVYLRRHWQGYRYWHRPVYWGHRHYYRHAVYWRHRHYYGRPVYWRHRHHYRYWGPARRHCGWW